MFHLRHECPGLGRGGVKQVGDLVFLESRLKDGGPSAVEAFGACTSKLIG